VFNNSFRRLVLGAHSTHCEECTMSRGIRWSGVLLCAALSVVLVLVAIDSGSRADDQKPIAKAEARTFRSTDGKNVRAKVVSIGETEVVLEQLNKKRITVPIASLSQADQDYLAGLTGGSPGSPAPSGGNPNAPAIGGAMPAKGAAADGNDWYQWRGPNRDGLCSETGLNDEWPNDGPPVVWRTRGLGAGMSSVAISQGRIYTLGKQGGESYLICRALDGGNELWKTPVGGGDNPNCTPTVDPASNLVFGVSHGGDLLCAEADTGREVWRKNFGRDFGGQMMSMWGYSESPLVDGDRLICTPGSPRAMLAALDKRTGAIEWTTPTPPGSLGGAGKDGAGYSSVVISNGGGVKQYIQLVGRGLISVSAQDGRGLWNYNRVANGTANIPTPIVTGNYVFTSSGYDDGGTALLEITGQGRNVGVREVYYKRANELQNHHGGMVLVGDYVYMGHGHNNGFPACVELRSGRNVWDRARGAGSGSAAIVYADGDIYFRYQDGTMALVEANPQGYNLKRSFKLATRNGESWPHPVIQGGRMYIRDQDELLCYDLTR
jgi:outer membrane protein assembly factor BamB